VYSCRLHRGGDDRRGSLAGRFGPSLAVTWVASEASLVTGRAPTVAVDHDEAPRVVGLVRHAFRWHNVDGGLRRKRRLGVGAQAEEGHRGEVFIGENSGVMRMDSSIESISKLRFKSMVLVQI
jgi:hypothetical protein